MKLKSTLIRLQDALGWNDRANRLVLSQGRGEASVSEPTPEGEMNMVIGYNGSANSQVALDLALWIAHQTRLATYRKVLVHVVYVVDRRQPNEPLNRTRAIAQPSRFQSVLSPAKLSPAQLASSPVSPAGGLPLLSVGRRHTDAALDRIATLESCLRGCDTQPSAATQTLLDQADCVLWQARCLAEEWRGSLEAHLRFGRDIEELQQVATEVKAELLVMGCSSPDHRLVQPLSGQLECPILGIPSRLEEF